MSSAAAKLGVWSVQARRHFFKMNMREKVLLLLFAFALVFVWFSWQFDRHAATQGSIAAAHRLDAEQKNMLSYEEGVRVSYEELISEINLEELPTKDEVAGQIDALVRRAGFTAFDLGQARTEEGTGLNFHTFQLSVQKATYPQIKSFTASLKSELPYVSLERIVIQAQARDDQFVDTRYVLKSLEYAK